jgi:two-component system, sensor histidine kinase and response regulator
VPQDNPYPKLAAEVAQNPHARANRARCVDPFGLGLDHRSDASHGTVAPMGSTDARTTVLVIDDNETNRELARQTLEDEGYRVLLASGGNAGIVIFESEAPDCILLDVRMPEVDGFAACEKIRAKDKDVPIIFLTALRDVETFDRALRVGGNDFLTKPVRPTELVVRVQSALKLRKMSSELQQHYALLKGQRDDLMRLQLQKERLMAFVVHDLKSPVNAIDLHAQLLLRDKTLRGDAKDSVTRIRAEARQLNRMVLNLLDLSKGDEGKLSPKYTSVNAPELIKEVLAELEALARYRTVHLENPAACETLRADEDLLRRMLTNLVENAVRHAPRETTVTVTLESTPAGAELRVIDRGTGIPEGMREQVFEPFKQLEGGALPSSRSGRGLGLTFCKLVAEAHHGRIWVEDAAPGAVFCVGLPHEA